MFLCSLVVSPLVVSLNLFHDKFFLFVIIRPIPETRIPLCLCGQFILEAVTGGDQGSIAIDNIEVYRSETDSCPAERECTFQGSLCGLQPQPSANFTWARLSGESKPADSSGPTADHTLGTDQGLP